MTTEQKAAFVASMAEHGIMRVVCKKTGIDKAEAIRQMRDDPAFCLLVKEAKGKYTDKIFEIAKRFAARRPRWA
jgi:hypothetical protein